MHQTAALLKTLKQTLKANGKTYADVAAELGLSEVSVKRLFTSQGFSLLRLEQVFGLMHRDNLHISQLTLKQEQHIVADIKLLLVAVCVLNRYSLNDILDRYALTEPECIRKLVELDRMQFIVLLPRNRIKLLVSPDFAWIPGGPIKHFFEQYAQAEFFASDFSKTPDKLLCLNAALSAPASAMLMRKLEEFRAEFSQISQADTTLPVNDRQWATLVMGFRHWQPSIFDELRKKTYV